jgi:bacterioferritin
MKGNTAIIDLLNEVLGDELVAINQYFLHGKLCASWGYKRLAARSRRESMEEMKHAEELVERILFLEGLPNLQKLGKLSVGETVKEQLDADLALERRAHKRLNDGIQLCRKHSDAGSEELVRRILGAEEQHIDWLETQRRLIEELGEANYLAQQLEE